MIPRGDLVKLGSSILIPNDAGSSMVFLPVGIQYLGKTSQQMVIIKVLPRYYLIINQIPNPIFQSFTRGVLASYDQSYTCRVGS